MRIISGTRKGRHIEPPKGIVARPTTDFAKEALFDVLSGKVDFEESTVLDLFSGTGSISYEFASRGAKSVTAVESNRMQATFIRRVAETLEFDQIQVICGDVFNFLRGTAKGSQVAVGTYDVVFADPPYALETLESLPDMVLDGGLLREGGVFVLEHGKRNDFTYHPACVDSRKYGNVHFSFFQVGNANL